MSKKAYFLPQSFLSKVGIFFLSTICVFCFTNIFQSPEVHADVGLVAHWAMDDGSGNTASDSSGYSNNETINGTATWVPGKIGGALSLDGSTNYAHLTTFNSPPASTMSLCSWIKTSSATQQVMLSFGRKPSGFNNEGIFSVLPSGSIQFWDYGNGAAGFPTSGTGSTGIVDDGHWHLACFVKNNTSGTYYIDGVASGTVTAGANISYANSDWTIGKDYRDNDNYFNGLIDDMRVYNIALSSSQIAGLYGLVGYWKFDEGSGTVANDSSGNNNTGTIVGSPTWTTGKFNGALSFGSSQYVSIGDSAIAPAIVSSSQVTGTAWVYVNAATTSGAILKDWPDDSANDQFELGFEGNTGKISAYIKQSNGTVVGPVESTSTLPLNSWHLVAFTANGSSVILYIDGTAVASTTYNTTIHAGGNYIGIGAELNSVRSPAAVPGYFNGKIDDVHLYNRGLLPEEIQTLMESAPAQVLNLQATGTYLSGFSLTWNQNPTTDNVTDYLVQYSTNGGTSWTTVDTASTSTSYTLHNLPPGNYLFQVKAVNIIAQGPASNQVQINSPVMSYALGNSCLTLENIATTPGDPYGHYTMSANIDCSVVPNFTPIAFTGGFGGTFNGAGYTISNLTINASSTNDVGLFSQIQNGGIVENLNILNASITNPSGQYVGILSGYSNGSIQNSTVSGTVSGGYYVGGLVGESDTLGVISSSSAAVSITGDDSNGGGSPEYIGGFVGDNEGAVNHSYSSGTITNAVSSSDVYYVGGFIGHSGGGTLSYDYTTGPISLNLDSSQESYYVAGFIGAADNGVSIDHSYATGNISDPDDYAYEVGGFIGDSNATMTNDYATGNIYIGNDTNGDPYYIGGFVGGDDSGPITNCYSTGSITAAYPQSLSYIGGFAGYNEDTISDSYSTGNIQGSLYMGGFTGYSQGVLTEVFASGSTTLFGPSPQYIGGFVGSNYAEIDDAYATGNITLDSGVTGNPQYIGGLVGYNSDATINRTYASGNVSVGTNSIDIGGLIGEFMQNTSSLNNSYSVGPVSSGSATGGLVGFANLQNTGNPIYTDATWYTGSASNAVGDVMINNGATDNGPLLNLTTGGYGTDEHTISNLYSTTEPVYAQAQSGAWNFSSIWEAHANTFPTFQLFTSTYSIIASAGTGGSISNPGSLSVLGGANQSYTISPNSGYTILTVLVDGVSVGPVSTYAFSNLGASHSISATFALASSAPTVFDSGPPSGSGAATQYICNDPKASNYTASAVCTYSSVVVSTPSVPVTPVTPSPTTTVVPVTIPSTSISVPCALDIYPTKNIRFVAQNDPAQVVLLQKYLDTYENAGLPIDGTYSKQDVAAVIAWQEKYSSDILTPWNLTQGTGFIYITSLRKFKALFDAECQEQATVTSITQLRDLQIGMSGADVRSLQQALVTKMTGPAAQALAKNGVTSYFGTLTKAALIEFQRENGITPANGILDSTMRSILFGYF